MSNWIPVTERLPEVGERVLAVDKYKEVFKAWITDDVYKEQGGSGGWSGWFAGNYLDNFGDSPVRENVTHWMPLPEPPKESE